VNRDVQLASGQHYCSDFSWKMAPAGVRAADFFGLTLYDLGQFLGQLTGRPVADKTGIQGRFSFHLEFAREDSDSTQAPGIFAAVEQQLGLKLAPQKAPVEYLVIDHVEKPSGN
jgi:uncharacterized protein (TIGR03435 family)